jgi:type VI secretion system protein ImpM
MSESVAEGPGFFGKVRTHGDFVSRRLPPEFVTPWDERLQEGMLFARQTFGAQWLPIYLNAPLWCFVTGAGVCGAKAWAGVLMPGVDRVGRYFPFTIAVPLEGGELAGWLGSAQAWFDAAAQLALSTLAADFVLERFDAQLTELGRTGGGQAATAWRLTLADTSSAGEDFSDLLAACTTPGSSAWWSEGSDAVPASLRVGAGLPDAQRFASLLDAACLGAGWQTVVALRPVEAKQ